MANRIAEEDDRFTKGKDSIEIFVHEVPETCEKCPFYARNVNRVRLEDAVFYFFLRARLVSAQYGGVDVAEPKQYKCPLKALIESDEYIEMDERVSELEEKVALLEKCCEEMHEQES